MATAKPGSAVELKHLRAFSGTRGAIKTVWTTWECDQADGATLELYLWETTYPLGTDMTGRPMKITNMPKAMPGRATIRVQYRVVDAGSYAAPSGNV